MILPPPFARRPQQIFLIRASRLSAERADLGRPATPKVARRRESRPIHAGTPFIWRAGCIPDREYSFVRLAVWSNAELRDLE